LSICGRANAVGKKDPLGGIPPIGSFLIFKTSKINQHGVSRRRNYKEKGNKNSPKQITIIFNPMNPVNPDSNQWLLRE
jgi:hypothetical protein